MGNGEEAIARSITPSGGASEPIRLYVIARDETGLRAVVVIPDADHGNEGVEAERALQEQGFEVAKVSGFGVGDAMRSFPSWFESRSSELPRAA